MKRKIIWLVVSCLVAVALVVGSCGPADEEEEVVVEEEEEEVVVEEEEEEEEVAVDEEEDFNILFSDDFSDESSGWDTYSNESGWVRYQDGWLHINAYTSGGIHIDSYAHQYFTDFVLEVETKFVDGTDDNWHAVCCRENDEYSYYEFSISADGYYRLAVWIFDEDIDPSNRPTFSSHIRQGRDVINLIRAECVGSNLRLLVNGHLLAEMTDSRLTGGDITLGVGSLAGTHSEIAFDNLVITSP